MNLRLFALALGLTSLVPCAHAQVGLYFNPIVTRATNSTPDNGPFAFLGQNSTAGTFGGISMGGYYTALHGPKYDVAVDFRNELQHGNSALLNSVLIGARVTGKLSHAALKPYIQLSGGGGTTHSQHNPVRANKGMFKVYGGLDIALNRHIDFKALEVGYGSVTTISSGLYGGTRLPAANLFSISAGFVFRIPVRGHN